MRSSSIPRATSIASSLFCWTHSSKGSPFRIVPDIFVDNDAAIARGWTQGYPKRLGSVFQTRYYAATGKAGPALAAGSKFAGTVSAGGQRLAEGVVTLREAVTDLSVLHQRPVVNVLHTPRLAAGMRDNRPYTNWWRCSPRPGDSTGVDRRRRVGTAGLQG